MFIICLFSSVQFSCSVVSDSLRPHESQHARPPCPSPTPGQCKIYHFFSKKCVHLIITVYYYCFVCITSVHPVYLFPYLSYVAHLFMIHSNILLFCLLLAIQFITVELYDEYIFIMKKWNNFQIIMSTFCFQENNINISAWIILMNYFQQLPAEYKKNDT